MRRSTAALGALLALSAALNILLLARGRSEPPRPPAERPRAAREVEASPADASLARQVETLEARIRELETDKRVLAEPGPAVDRLGELREKLRKVAAMYADSSDFGDPLNQLTFSEVTVEINRLTLGRDKDPKAYADMLRVVYELALEKPPLSEGQKKTIGRAFDELGAALAGVKADSAGDRLLKSIEIEAAAIERVREAIGPERAERLDGHDILMLTEPDGVRTYYITEKARDQEILDVWARSYGLDPAQQAAAREVARAFTAEMQRLGGPSSEGIFPSAGTPEAYKLRTDLLRAQLGALGQLEGGWTREQRERLKTRAPREFFILGAPQAVVEEKK